MHIPDGFLDTKTVVATTALATIGVALATQQVRRRGTPQEIPLVGLSAAFVFVAQTLNFPVAAGTSGHLVGATLIASLLGLSSACLAMTAVLVLQCFLFADGGVTALGANLLNMAIVAPLTGYGVFRLVCRGLGSHLRGRLTGVAFGGWCSVVATSLLCAGELASSGVAEGRTIFPAMGGIHALIGVGEGVITAIVYAGIARARPELLEGKNPPRQAEVFFLGGVGALALAAFVAPFASPLPDGLEHVAELLGFGGREELLFPSPLSDYEFPGVRWPGLATAMSALLGTALAFGFAYGLARLLTREEKA